MSFGCRTARTYEVEPDGHPLLLECVVLFLVIRMLNCRLAGFVISA